MKKRALALILALIMILSCGMLTGASAAGKKEGQAVSVQEALGNATPKKIVIEGSHYVGKGKKIELEASVTPASADQDVTWKSEDTKIAKVNSKGVVTGVKIGKTKITAVSKAKKTVKKSWVIIVRKPTTKITISASTKKIDLSSGDVVLKLKGKVTPSSAAPNLEWTSSNTKIATVDSGGKVTGKKTGTVTITAAARDGSKKKATIKIKVVDSSEDPENPDEPSDDTVYRALLIGEKTFLRYDWEYYTDIANRNVADVNHMATMLSGVYGPKGTKYRVTKKTDLSYSGIKNAIKNTFANTTDNDVSLFFIASHGNSDGDGELEIAFTGDPENYSDLEAYFENSLLPFGTLASWLKTYVKGKVIVILESCGAGSAIYDPEEQNSNGSMTRKIVGFRNLTGREGDAAAAKIAKTAVRAFEKADPGIIENSTTGELRSSKFYVLAASRHQEMSWGTEGSNPQNFFTTWLIEGVGSIGNSPADISPKDGKVNLTELFNYIKKVGDDYPFNTSEGVYYQHVQRYPVGSKYNLFLVKNP